MIKDAKGLIGLSIKARKISFGTEGTKDAIRSKKSKLVLLSDVASKRSKKDMNDICAYYDIMVVQDGFSDIFYELTNRKEMIVMSINDEGFAKAIKNKLKLL